MNLTPDPFAASRAANRLYQRECRRTAWHLRHAQCRSETSTVAGIDRSIADELALAAYAADFEARALEHEAVTR